MIASKASVMRRWRNIGKYLICYPRLVSKLAWQDMTTKITAFTDSDWAGCKVTRASTSGGVITWGGGLLKSWSKTQGSIALSSGEAEFYAAVKGCKSRK